MTISCQKCKRDVLILSAGQFVQGDLICSCGHVVLSARQPGPSIRDENGDVKISAGGES